MVGADPGSYAVRVAPFLRYTALRLLVLLVVGAGLWFAGLRGLLWALITVVVAAGISYVLLSEARDALLDRLSKGRPARVVDEDDEDAAAEDAALGSPSTTATTPAGDLPEMRERSVQGPAVAGDGDDAHVTGTQDASGSGSGQAQADAERHRENQL